MASSSTRPTRIKVGYLTFNVDYLTEAGWKKAGHDDDAGGHMEGYTGTISVRVQSAKQHEDCTREILLHEIMHACWYVAGFFSENLKEFDDIEESSILRTSPILLSVLQDNPDLMAYLTP